MNQQQDKVVEVQIKDFIVEKLLVPEKEAASMTLQQRMSLIESKDKHMWDKFKKGLRIAGYII